MKVHKMFKFWGDKITIRLQSHYRTPLLICHF